MDVLKLLKRCADYLAQAELHEVPGWRNQDSFELSALAQGEYNFNALLQQGDLRWVLRINMGSQIDCEQQILYEYQTLCRLEPIGRTPKAYFVDPHASGIGKGLMIMQYLPGKSLDYRRDSEAAAQLLAEIHNVTAGRGRGHLIEETHPLSMIYEECQRLLQIYFHSSMADRALCDYLQDVLAWAEVAQRAEEALQADPWRCVINTEVNGGNFIVNRAQGSLHLVDWEKALWGDPSQDLSHFCAPTSTLWKTKVRFTLAERKDLMHAYKSALEDNHLRDTIEDRVRIRDPFNYLRGIAWSAMAWVQYQTGEHTLRNEDTFQTVCAYLQLPFLRSLFDLYLARDPLRWV